MGIVNTFMNACIEVTPYVIAWFAVRKVWNIAISAVTGGSVRL